MMDQNWEVPLICPKCDGGLFRISQVMDKDGSRQHMNAVCESCDSIYKVGSALTIKPVIERDQFIE